MLTRVQEINKPSSEKSTGPEQMEIDFSVYIELIIIFEDMVAKHARILRINDEDIKNYIRKELNLPTTQKTTNIVLGQLERSLFCCTLKKYERMTGIPSDTSIGMISRYLSSKT